MCILHETSIQIYIASIHIVNSNLHRVFFVIVYALVSRRIIVVIFEFIQY